MATLDGIQLFDTACEQRSGGAFLINRASRASLSVLGDDGWTVEVKDGCRYAIASIPKTLTGYQETIETAFKAAQRGLDHFSISRSADLGIRDAKTEHLTWWPEPAGQVLRTTTVVTIGVKFEVTVTATDAAGNVVPDPPSPPPTWHSSLRYFRLAQITDDLFDAYRNLYLGLEAILDRIARQTVNAAGRPTEGEGDWFKRALGAAHTRVDLASYAPKGSTNPVQSLYDELYVATRTALFHAKQSRPSFLPHEPGKENEVVTAAVDRLSRLYLALARTELGNPSGGGGFTYNGFKHVTEPWITKMRLQATDDDTPVSPATCTLNPNGGAVIDLVTRHVPELDGGFIRSFLGCASGSEVGKLPKVATLGAKLDETLFACGSVEGVLVPSGVERFESQMGFRLRNSDQPREYFST